MSTRDEVFHLQKELAFWERVHEHEGPSEIEDDLKSQIEQLKNRDQFGVPRYNGHVKREDAPSETISSGMAYCRYCGKTGLRWDRVDGRWRLLEYSQPHVCTAYKNRDQQE